MKALWIYAMIALGVGTAYLPPDGPKSDGDIAAAVMAGALWPAMMASETILALRKVRLGK